MATLETQYKNYLNEHPDSILTFDEWKIQFGENIKSALQRMFDEVSTPEYKQKQIEENQKYLDEVTVDYHYGYFVGEHIVNRYLPTLSTDMLQSRNVIKVSEEDIVENVRLNDEWFKTTRHNDDWDGENDGNKNKWELYFQHNKMLEQKYLPKKLDCHLRLLKINDEKEFKEGLRSSLWDCDMCSYNIDVENIKIENDMVNGFTIITFQLDENVS
jgi:hypothetical protein